jgi:HlyD family secretion protein
MKIIKWIIIILMMLLTALLLRRWLGPSVAVWPMQRQTISQHLVATGLVATPHRVHIAAQITGTVQQVNVDVGDKVTAGELLLQLDDREWIAMVNVAQQQVEHAKLAMRYLDQVQRPQAQYDYDEALSNHLAMQRAWLRQLDLIKRGFSQQALLDEAQRAAQSSHSRLLRSQQSLDSFAADGSQRALVAQQLRQASADLVLAQTRLSLTAIHTPQHALVMQRWVEPGDQVWLGQRLLQLSPIQHSELVIQIDEKHLHWLALGQSALASADAYPSQQFKATVVHIAAGVDAESGTVQVKLQVPVPPAYLRQDMTVSVDIQVARHPNVWVVPRLALVSMSPAIVMIVRQRHVQLQPITLGICTVLWCEVIDGLIGDEWLVPAESALTISVGSPIRAKRLAPPIFSPAATEPIARQQRSETNASIQPLPNSQSEASDHKTIRHDGTDAPQATQTTEPVFRYADKETIATLTKKYQAILRLFKLDLRLTMAPCMLAYLTLELRRIVLHHHRSSAHLYIMTWRLYAPR